MNSGEACLLCAVLSTAGISFINGQFRGFGCPPGWETFGDSCYEFVFHPSRSYQESAQACWTQGSALLSVNSMDEHRFVADYLLRHDYTKSHKWYTSGVMELGAVKWNGDGSSSNTTIPEGYWNSAQSYNFPYRHLVYQYSVQLKRYGWGKTSVQSVHNYICEIPKAEIGRLIQQLRGFDYGKSQADLSLLPRGPKFIVKPISTVVVETPGNSHVFIECVANGNPLPRYSWYQYNSTTGTSSLVTSSTNSAYTFTNGRFTIQTPEERRDAALYQCKAENEFGSILTAPVTLSFGYLNQFPPTKQGFVEAFVYQGTKINCNAPSAKPGLAYQWYKNDARGFIRPELMNYFFISSNGNLYLSEVQYNDAGEYFCIVTLVAPVDQRLSTDQPPSRTSRGIELRTKINPSTKYGPIIHDDFIAVFPKPPLVGHQITLECFAYGRSLVYSWTRQDEDFPEGTFFSDSNRVLTIPKAKFEDRGNYTCNVMTTAYQASDSRSIYLNIEAKPFFTFPLRDMHADAGSELTWRCEAQASPKATYSWYKNSKLLRHVPGDVEIRQNVLFIRNLDQTRHAGMYQCTATNAHGTSVTSAQLRVLSFKPDFTKTHLSPTTIGAVGGNVTIACAPEAAPVPVITWFHNGQQLSSAPGGHYEILIDGTLKISELSFSDQGTYMCKASNVNGDNSSSTVLSVMAGLTFLHRPVDKVGDVNRTSFLYCEASYDYNKYDLVYVWKFNGRVIDTKRSPFYRKGQSQNVHGLYVINAQFYHTGMYECTAQTVLTSISTSAHLTIQGPPGAPAGVFVEDGSIVGGFAKLVWTWEPKNNHGFPVNYFAIEAKTEYSDWEVIAEDIPSPKTELTSIDRKHFFKVYNLLPFNSYSFRVLAKNERGVGPSSRPTIMYRIPAAAPTQAPTNVGGGQGTVGVLTMTWQALPRSLEGGLNFGYIVYWRLASQNRTAFQTKEVGNVSQYVATVGEDNYYLLYEVKVQAKNEHGVGPMSDVALVYSSEGMPVAVPQNVDYVALHARAILVTWDPVPNTREAVKGQILGYEIDYTEVDSPFAQSRSKNIYCVCGQGVIVGLAPDTDFWVTVAVFTAAGTGSPSERRLMGSEPHPPRDYPKYVEIHPHGKHSIRVQWRGVNIRLGENGLTGYKIIYWPVHDNVKTAKKVIVGKVTSAVIDGLQYGMTYRLRVMGLNSGGDGKKSEAVFFTFAKDGAVNIGYFDPSTTQLLLPSNTYSLHHQAPLITTLCLTTLFKFFIF